MDIRHRTDIIAGYYSRLKDFQWSEKYSRSDQFVYIAKDQSGWIVVDWKNRSRVQVRLTDKDGCDVKSLNLTVWRIIRPNQPFRWLKPSPLAVSVMTLFKSW